MTSTSQQHPTWLTWGQCIALCREHNVSRYQLLKMSAALKPDGTPELERRCFPGCSTHRYRRSALLTLLGVTE